MLAAPDRRAEACQRLPQILVRDLRHAGSDTFGRNGIDRAAGRCIGRRSGACRKTIRSTARQPRKRLTRSQITLARCWISIAAGPSTRKTSVPAGRPNANPSWLVRDGPGADTARGHWILIGSLWAATSPPTISVQRVTSSAEAKPCRVKVSPTTLLEEVAQRLCKRAGGLVHNGVLCHPSDHDGSSEDRGATACQAPQRCFIPATHRLARLVRPSSPEIALARGAGRACRSLPGLAVRDYVAADDGCYRHARIMPAFWPAGAMWARWRPRRSTTCLKPGPD